MTILFIGPLPEPVTGQSLACRVLLDDLSNRYEVAVVDLSKKEFVQGVTSVARVREVLRMLRGIWQQRLAADAIYLTVSQSLAGNVKDLVIYAICYRKLHRMVVHLHGGAGMRDILHGSRRLRALNRFFLKHVGGAIVLGDSHRDIYHGIVPHERVHVVPNFAEDEVFTTAERIDAKFNRPETTRVLFLSNLLPGKGHEELVDAFKSLDEDAKRGMRVDLAGGFESDHQKERFLAKIAGEDRIRYHGVVAGERKRALLEQAHVFCLPTYYPYEGQPISMLEAFASGCAVITTDHSGIPDVFRDGVNGLQVRKRSVADIRQALMQAVVQSHRLRQMAQTNFTTALAAYRASAYQQSVSHIIESVAEA